MFKDFSRMKTCNMILLIWVMGWEWDQLSDYFGVVYFRVFTGSENWRIFLIFASSFTLPPLLTIYRRRGDTKTVVQSYGKTSEIISIFCLDSISLSLSIYLSQVKDLPFSGWIMMLSLTLTEHDGAQLHH